MFFRMHFKKASLHIFYSWLFVGLAGCGLRIADQPPAKPEIRVGEFSCMQDISKTIHRYVSAKQNKANETEEFFGCMKRSLEAFATYVRGDQTSYYTPEELRKFFERFVLKNQKISDALLSELMIMKVNLVGGSLNRLSRQEIARGMDLLEQLRAVFVELGPHMKILNPNLAMRLRMEGRPLPPVEETIRAVRAAGDRLGELMAFSHRPYAIKNLRQLLEELREFANLEDEFTTMGSVENWMQLLTAFKEITVHPSVDGNDFVAPEEWRLLTYQLAGWYTLWIRFHNSIAIQNRFSRSGVESILAFFREARDLLERALASQSQQVIEFDKMDRLFVAMDRLHIMPLSMTPDIGSQMVRIIVERVFGNPEIIPDKRKTNGLTAVTLYQMGVEVGLWANIQLVLNDFFLAQEAPRYNPLYMWLRSGNIRNSFEPEDLAHRLRNVFTGDESYFASYLRFVRNSRPLVAPWPNDVMRVFLVNEKELATYKIGYSFQDLSWKNLMLSALRLLVRGYAESSERGKAWGVSKRETQKFYMDFKPFGESLHIFDPRNCKAGARSFLEGKLFTYTGTGYDETSENPRQRFLSFESGAELLSFLVSGGLEGRSLYADYLQRCQPPDSAPQDPFKDSMIEKSCFLGDLSRNLLMRLKGMPRWQAYFAKLTFEDQLQFVSTLLVSVKDSRTAKDWIEQQEMSSMLVVLQYIEAVFTRFDENLDDVLDDREVQKAYPIYRKLIQEAALRMGKNLNNEEKIRYAFNYILYYGEIPEDTAQDLWIGLTARVAGWGFRLTRMEVMRAFKVIVQSILESDRKSSGGDSCKTDS